MWKQENKMLAVKFYVRFGEKGKLMSRVGNAPVLLTKGVDVQINSHNEVSIKSGQNLLKIQVNPVIKVKVHDGKVLLTRKNDEPQTKAWHGLYRALISNAVVGVSSGWERKLVFKGVGYKAQVSGTNLEMNLGYSHPIKMVIPTGLTVKTEKSSIIVQGADRAKVSQFAAQIRSLRKPEPYLGKGVRYSDEKIRRKAGKSGGDK